MAAKLESFLTQLSLRSKAWAEARGLARQMETSQRLATFALLACGIGTLSSLPMGAAAGIDAPYLPFLRDLASSAAFLGVIILGALGYLMASRLIFLTVVALCCAAGTLLHGNSSAFSLPLIPLVAATFMIFTPRERAAIAYGTALPLLTFAAVSLFNRTTPPTSHSDANILGMGLSLIATGLLALAFYRDHWKMEARLQESNRVFQLLAQNVSDAIWLLSPDFSRIVFASSALEKQFDIPPGEPHGFQQLILEKVHPEDRPHLLQLSTRALQGPVEVEFRIPLNENECRWLWLRAAPIRNEDGDTVAICGVTTDVTLQKENLAKVEQERAEIITAGKLALLVEMAGGIAHEINNPVMIIEGKVQQLERSLKVGAIDLTRALALLEGIRHTSRRIALIIRGLQAFARDAGNDPFTTVSLEQIIRNVLALCSEKLRSQNIAMDIVMPEPDITLECRESQLAQILLNLIGNAHDAVESLSERWIRIETMASNDWIEVSITDSGTGIPPDVASRLFQPFFSTKEVGKGSGLGLGSSRGLAQAHRGSLEYDATSAHTRFVLRLPRHQRAVQARAA